MLCFGTFANLAQAHEHHGTHKEEKSNPILSSSIYNLESKWTNQDGKVIKLDSLRGKVTVLAMAYTSCQAACPILTANMKEIENKLSKDIKDKTQFAIFSFDHEKDVPEKLKSYSNKQSLDPIRWSLFHGTKKGVHELALVLGIKYKKDSKGDYEHSNVITVLDSEGNIKYQQVGLNTNPMETISVIQKLNK